MIKACVRCRPAHKLGIMEAHRIPLPDGTLVEEWTSLCEPCREAAAEENQAGRKRLAKVLDLPVLEFLFTAPSAKEPAR